MTDPTPKKRRVPRETISASLRFEILSRCNFACYYCGTPAALGLKVLHVDHVLPVVYGGTNDPWNLVAACWDCNAGKGVTVPSDELVRAVRDDYATWYRLRVTEVRQCAYCGAPVLRDEGDDPWPPDAFVDCPSCNNAACTGFDAGVRAAGGAA